MCEFVYKSITFFSTAEINPSDRTQILWNSNNDVVNETVFSDRCPQPTVPFQSKYGAFDTQLYRYNWPMASSHELLPTENCDISQTEDKLSSTDYYSRGSANSNAFGGAMNKGYPRNPPSMTEYGLAFKDIQSYTTDHAGRLHIHAK